MGECASCVWRCQGGDTRNQAPGLLADGRAAAGRQHPGSNHPGATTRGCVARGVARRVAVRVLGSTGGGCMLGGGQQAGLILLTIY